MEEFIGITSPNLLKTSMREVLISQFIDGKIKSCAREFAFSSGWRWDLTHDYLNRGVTHNPRSATPG